MVNFTKKKAKGKGCNKVQACARPYLFRGIFQFVYSDFSCSGDFSGNCSVTSFTSSSTHGWQVKKKNEMKKGVLVPNQK